MNQKTSLAAFRFLAWFVAVYHLLLGLAATFGTGAFVISLANNVYGISLNVDSGLFMSIARFIGSYMIAFGLMMAMVALKPVEYKKLAWVAVILFAIRIFDRVVFFSVLQKALNATVASNLQTVIPIAIIAVGLILTMPKGKA